ncbi:hypothetical protein EV702DRAFT_972861 [Suillus placidus]|uniref:Protein-S-isoprenylcysteine O-methyltransferase n=1 Tax=Suillus placidus TaxID=48579 RepID=A0A9P6ZS09_9AGAM|nr:hypothetical protein EV702DRAFT_972861 [Suillus placidus]
MSLLKIPFIIASAIGVHVSLTTSSRQPSSEEKVIPTASESFGKWIFRLGCLELMVISIWAVSAAEVANIIAMHIGPSQISEGIYGASAIQLMRTLRPTPITHAFLASSLAIAMGGAFRLYCMSTLGKLWSFQLSIRKEHRLVTDGPYSIVRHPSYTAFFLQYVGIIVMYGGPGSWMRQSGILQVPFMKVPAAIIFVAYTVCAWIVIVRLAVEDKMMQRAMGEDWENWAKQVKYRLLPGVY